MTSRCSRSTAIRSPTAPTTRCRSRSAAAAGRQRARRLRELPAPALGRGAARRGARRRGTPSRRRPTGTRRCRRTSRAASSRPSILEQLDVLPALVESFGFAVAKARRLRGRRLPRRGGGRAGRARSLVATSDRDAFQLVSDRVTILQPVKGVSELARIGPAEVRERYGVEPEQVPDFIALRGDPSDRIPGAPGIGPKKAADLLEAVRHARGGARRRPLLDDRRRPAAVPRIATMDAAAPLPALGPTPPDWARAAAAGARARAERARRPARRASAVA